jgi:hypothetical protein
MAWPRAPRASPEAAESSRLQAFPAAARPRAAWCCQLAAVSIQVAALRAEAAASRPARGASRPPALVAFPPAEFQRQQASAEWPRACREQRVVEESPQAVCRRPASVAWRQAAYQPTACLPVGFPQAESWELRSKLRAWQAACPERAASRQRVARLASEPVCPRPAASEHQRWPPAVFPRDEARAVAAAARRAWVRRGPAESDSHPSTVAPFRLPEARRAWRAAVHPGLPASAEEPDHSDST